jgi:hypothetical protein
MEMSLLLASMFYLAFGSICLFEATPRAGARLVAAVAFAIAAVFLFFGGLAMELIFRRDLRRMDVNWRLFSFDLISHSHPFSEINIRIRMPGVVSGSGSVGYMRYPFYSADIGSSHYLLGYPESLPISDAQLKVVRNELGFRDDSPTQDQKGDLEAKSV